MLKFLLTLGVGIYAGIYIDQNYDVPRVDEPSKIIDKIRDYIDQRRKKTVTEKIVDSVKSNVKKIME